MSFPLADIRPACLAWSSTISGWQPSTSIAFASHCLTPRCAKQLEGLGPFFIATLEPLDELVRTLPDGSTHVNANVVALLVDISGSHPKSMPAYVNAFKDAVRGEVPTQFTTLSPLRARFASAVVDLGEAVPFVAEAYAGTLKTFSGARP